MKNSQDKIKVLIVDDHPTMSFGTKMILGSFPSIEVIGIAETGATAMEMIEQQKPDLVFLDLLLPDTDGIEVAKKAKRKVHGVHIIVFTGMDYTPLLGELLSIGVSGILSKEDKPEQIVWMVRAVLEGKTIVPLSVFQRLCLKDKQDKTGEECSFLTDKEKLILKLVGQGCTNKQIAKEIFVTTRSVEYYLTRIYEKLDVKSRTEAITKYRL